MTALLVVALGGCRHGTAPSPTTAAALPSPAGAPRPFAALYRVECCGQSSLVATLRGDGRHLLVSVAAPPASVVVEAFLEEGGGWLRRGGERCVRPLPPGVLPLAGGATLPLDPWLAALLVSGLVPAEARPAPQRAGRFELRGSQVDVAWQVKGGGLPVVTRVEIAGVSDAAPLLTAQLSEHHQRVPGRLRVRAGSQAADLRLLEWRSAGTVAKPAWAAATPCEGGA